jgi:ATP-dependent DNA helicase RecG
MLKLDTPIQYVRGVGPKRAAALMGAGIRTVEEFLDYKPFRYEDRTNFKKIKSLREGEYAVVSGVIKVGGSYSTPKSGTKIFEMAVADESGFIYVKFFNQPYLKNALTPGLRLIVYGQVKYDSFRPSALCFINPEYEILDEDKDAFIHTGRVVPVYRRLGDVSPKALRTVAYAIFQDLSDEFYDPLPDYLREKYRLLPKGQALTAIHFPTLDERDYFSRLQSLESYNTDHSPAHTRMIFEEFFELQVGLNYLKKLRHRERKNQTYEINDQVREAVKKILPFHPTAAQKRALKEIVDDLRSTRPMNRLLQGDVGCGKTIVALQAMVIAMENGWQTALMAPTEILAEQHYLNIKRWLSGTNYRVALLTSGVKKKLKEEIRQEINAGQVGLVVGTHAIIQEDVRFRNLGFVVIDEQHRFGVIQRADLIRKGYDPDTLVMTATPIPRSLALTVYGDLDISVIDELPPGRTPVKTILRTNRHRDEVYRMIRAEVEKGRQAYVIYPLVEESEKVDLKAATQMADHLAKEVFPNFRVGLLHGRLKPQEKEEVMGRFAAGEIDILVSTTVIEVGVDVPNATIMVIEHAERFGLAQLHQLRGRVGRGTAASLCVLLAEHFESPEARKRLEIMCRTNDGFQIAEVDLEIRGPGEFAGTRQSGLPSFRFGNIVRDRRWLELAREEAIKFLDRVYIDGDEPMAQILDRIKNHWEQKFGLALVG